MILLDYLLDMCAALVAVLLLTVVILVMGGRRFLASTTTTVSLSALGRYDSENITSPTRGACVYKHNIHGYIYHHHHK